MEIYNTCYCFGTYRYIIAVDSTGDTKYPRVLFHVRFVKFLIRVNTYGIF